MSEPRMKAPKAKRPDEVHAKADKYHREAAQAWLRKGTRAGGKKFDDRVRSLAALLAAWEELGRDIAIADVTSRLETVVREWRT